MSRLQEEYKNTLVPQLAKTLGFSNPMQVPKITKVTLNMGVGETTQDRKVMDRAMGDMEKIAGQKPIVRNARKSVASFKIRDGWPVGCKVTLRRERMYEFIDRLVNIAIPRERDFRGLSAKSFDGRGNYNFGIREQIIFPEVDYDQIDVIRGMNITVTTTARNDEEGKALLEAFNFPFRK
jgi:large subunit ribosomal protein L5